MQYRQFGKTGFKPSALGFGTMRLPCVGGGNSGSAVDMDKSVSIIRKAIDNGVNYIDTAYPYHGGVSETAVGKALRGQYRNKVKLADKSPVFFIRKESDFDDFLETQLRRLGLEHIDFYLLHAISRDKFRTVVSRFDILGKMERAKRDGKIGHIGFSFHDNFDAFEEVLKGYDGWEFCQIQLNFLDLKKQAGVEGLKAAAQKGFGVSIMEPLMGGRLACPPGEIASLFARSGRNAVQLALDYLWDMSEVSTVLSGMSNMEQLKQNLEFASQSRIGKLSEADRGFIESIRKKFDALLTIPCTGCQYCMPCPQGVAIPRNFSVYNDLAMYGDPSVAHDEFKDLLKWEGEKASAASCVCCGQCEAMCPQEIEISKWMPLVAKEFFE